MEGICDEKEEMTKKHVNMKEIYKRSNNKYICDRHSKTGDITNRSNK